MSVLNEYSNQVKLKEKSRIFVNYIIQTLFEKEMDKIDNCLLHKTGKGVFFQTHNENWVYYCKCKQKTYDLIELVCKYYNLPVLGIWDRGVSREAVAMFLLELFSEGDTAQLIKELDKVGLMHKDIYIYGKIYVNALSRFKLLKKHKSSFILSGLGNVDKRESDYIQRFKRNWAKRLGIDEVEIEKILAEIKSI
jgi:hypothetical protein